jgi:hypothetical protein
LYFGLLTAWVIAFVSAAVYFYIKGKRMRGNKDAYRMVLTDEMNVQVEKNFEKLRGFTWESLGKAIDDGEMLVVGNGSYVYDISRWVLSHPGGQLILQAVNGTDITNDYFHEAGFDANEFNPKAPAPKQIQRTPPMIVEGLSRADLIAANRASLLIPQNHMVNSIIQNQGTIRVSQFSEDDWLAIQRARRTHVHTRQAIQKLATLVVGKLITGTSIPQSLPLRGNWIEAKPFDPFEYRRYALTSAKVESSPSASRPIVRFRFCNLYPYDIRENERLAFESGEAIEIQIRLSNGERISRYYTPLNGDMNGFEILVKISPFGKMSHYLFNSVIGQKQFKIRGPFGRPLLANSDNITEEFESIYYFSGGSGITPCLQLLQALYLGVSSPLKVSCG